MAEPTLSVILPTVGRPTLVRALASVYTQRLIPGDEILVCPDGPGPLAVVRELRLTHPCQVLDLGGPYGDPGHSLRNRAMPRARADWLVFLDDDDEFTPGAFEVIRRELTREVPYQFRMAYPDGRVLWTEPVLRLGNVSTIMTVVPRRGPLGTWRERGKEGDYHFLRQTVELYSNEIEWRKQVITLVRPPRAGPVRAFPAGGGNHGL